MKNSIKNRLVYSFMLVIFIIVIAIGAIFAKGLRTYHYRAVQDQMQKNIELSINNLNLFYQNYNLKDIILNDYNKIWSKSEAQVQILTNDGELLLDTIGAWANGPIKNSDVVKASQGSAGVYIGTADYTAEKILAVSMPILNNDKTQVGIMRYISSLEQTDKIIAMTINIFIAFSIMIIALAVLLSMILSNSIVKPLIKLNNIANKMAKGQYKIRSDIDLNDEIGELSNTLNYMAEEILNREQIKNEFISSISHELRTPLTSIKGWASTLKAVGNQDENMFNDGLDIIERESDRLAAMVEELLDFSRYISGGMKLDIDVFSIKNTLINIATQMRPAVNKKGLKLILEMQDNFNLILGDENKIKQVLINLIDNASKFTNEGYIKIEALREENHLTIKIIDTGIGISKKELPHIKEKFYKGKHSQSHTGLGLSIADEIIKYHNGTLNIDSEEQLGTTVTIELPLPEEENYNE